MTGTDVTAMMTDAALELLRDGALRERELLRALRDRLGPGATRSPVLPALGADDRFAPREVAGRPGWGLADGVTADRRVVREMDRDHGPGNGPLDRRRPLDGLELRDWQVDAFAEWAAAGCRGVIEAITGAGKTRLAVAAVRAALARDGRALVLVPTLDLQDQWLSTLHVDVPGVRVGRLGGGGRADLHDHHVVVATPHAAAAVPLDLPGGGPGLLVADEAHRYGAPTWSGALGPAFTMRLALTATYERGDDGLVEVLGPYFGGVVHRYGYARATADGVIAPFSIGVVRVDLDDDEAARYARADQQARRLRGALLTHGLPRAPRETIAAAASLIAEHRPGTPHPAAADARAYLSALRARRDVAAQAGAKLALLRAAGSGLVGRRALVFTDTVEQAEAATRVLRRAGVDAEEVHGGLEDRRRRIRLAQLRNGALGCVVAPRVLDEGVDVPEADVAVVLATFRSRRQLVQRLGRVLRVKPDGREARLLLVAARGTREDPDGGAHEEFLAEVLQVARRVVDLTPREVADFLAP